jgi:hypothetical protein
MLFGCKLSLAMVSNSVRLRSSDRLPSGGTSDVVVVVVVGLGVDIDVVVGALEPSPQAASPTTRLTLIARSFTPVRLCVRESFVARCT